MSVLTGNSSRFLDENSKIKKFYSYLSLSLVTYIFMLFFLAAMFESIQQFVIWGIGPIFSFIVVLSYINSPFQMPKELLVYLLFWAYTIVGFTIAIDPDGFFRYFRLIFTIFVLFMCTVIVLVRTGNIAIIFKCFIWIAALSFVYSLVSGSFTASAIRQEDFRYGSIVTNPNGNAYIALTGLLGVLFIWNENKGTYKRYLLLFLMLLFSVLIVLTASRSGFISMIIMYILWPIYCYKNEIRKHLAIYLLGIIILTPALYLINDAISKNLYLGKRLSNTGASGDIIEDETRVKIYIEAFEIFTRHPVIGVGLSQFQNHSIYQGVAHSDSMELLATTGIIGFLLIAAIYVLLWRRINKLLRIIKDDKISYRLNFFKVIIVVIIVFGIFKPNFLDILTMIKISIISGYTYYLYYELVKLKDRIQMQEKSINRTPQLSH